MTLRSTDPGTGEDAPAELELDDKSPFLCLLVFFMVLKPLFFIWGLLQTSISRNMQFAADQYSVDNGYGAYLHSGLIAIHVNNSGCLNPDWLYETVHYTHPSLIERLAAIERRMSIMVKRKTGQMPDTFEEVLEQYSEQVQESLARKHPEAMEEAAEALDESE